MIWVCPKCDAENEAEFTICVHCRHDATGEIVSGYDPSNTTDLDGVLREVTGIIKEAIVAADKKHGPLPTDRCRQLAILTAEVGEVAIAILGTTGGSRPTDDDQLGVELAQVAATAVLMLIPLIARRLPEGQIPPSSTSSNKPGVH